MSTDHLTEHEALLRRLRALEDKDALHTLLLRGWHALDRNDWDTWSRCWTEDAVLEFGPWQQIHGREAIRAKVHEAEAPYATMQHHILNATFDVQGDRATGVGYMWFVAVAEPDRSADPYAMGGPYDWEFVRAEDGWRLSRLRIGVRWTRGEDTVRAFS
ncbi:nuclear transport factor 2 family protein [Streptomyces sp. NPDC047108]|uniref:nuclear transport factor 2 family protein n=1 Tax=Streptomyces sp. NPDC047108 TaxID=3155025 RepID=UPI0033F31CAD